MRAELYQGDCLELMKTLPDGCIDMVLTDPPYASTAQRWDKMLNWAEIWPELKRVCKVNAAKLFFSPSPSTCAQAIARSIATGTCGKRPLSAMSTTATRCRSESTKK